MLRLPGAGCGGLFRQEPNRQRCCEASKPHMGGCQNYGPVWGTLNIRCRIIIGIQKKYHSFDNHPHGI